MKFKKISAMILSLTLLFSAVSCEKITSDTSQEKKADVLSTEMVKSDRSWFIRPLPSPEKSGDILSAAPLGNGGYIAAFRTVESVVPELYIANDDLNGYTKCNQSISFRENCEINICFANSADGTLYAAVTEISHGDIPPYNYLDPENIPEDFDRLEYDSAAEYFHTVYKLSPEGAVESAVEITGLEETSIRDLTVSGGKFYISCGTVYAADEATGNAEEYTGSESEIFGNTGLTAGDQPVFAGSSGTEVCLETGGQVLSIDKAGSPYSHIHAGGEEYDLIFTGKTGVFAMKDNVLTQLALNVSLGINEGAAVDVFPVKNGYVLRVFDDTTFCNSLYLLTDTPEEDILEEPVTLKLGVLYQTDDFSSHVANFNRSGKNITIEPVYYTEFDVYDKEKKQQVSTGSDQLAMDLISGNSPDLIVFMNPPYGLAEKGAFADMYSLMDQELSRDMFLPNILESCEYSGKLYSLPTSFTVWSMIVKEKYSTTQDQTFEDMLRVIDDAPEGMEIMNAQSKREALCSFLNYAGYAVSMHDGKYSVNEADMEKLLKFCDRFQDDNYEAYYDFGNDEVIFREFAADRFGEFRTYYEMSDDPVTFAGYPSENLSGNVVSMTCNVAVMESCDNKKAAWEFVKSMYIGENSALVHGRNMGFPILKKDMEELEEVARNSGSFTKDEFDKAIEVVRSARRPANGMDRELFNIIIEEANTYFSGECTAAEAAYVIKNRTDIFISENE